MVTVTVSIECRANKNIEKKDSSNEFPENLAKSLNELIAMVRELREEVKRQREEIQHLRSLIENCAGCQKSPEPLRDSCQQHNPCFPGKNTVG